MAVQPSPVFLKPKRLLRSHTVKRGSVLRILLVEDNPGDVLLIQQILSTALPSVNIRVAMDGEQALRMLSDPDLKPDLVILDLNIPKVPGIAILAQCRPELGYSRCELNHLRLVWLWSCRLVNMQNHPGRGGNQ
jgi:hypothetical protein